MLELLSDLDGHELTVECTDPGDENIIFYIAGFIARSISKNCKCQDSKDLYIASDEVPALTFIEDGNWDSTKEDAVTRATFLKQVSRGGLCTLTNLVYISCIYIWNFYKTLDAHDWHYLLSDNKEIFHAMTIELRLAAQRRCPTGETTKWRRQ